MFFENFNIKHTKTHLKKYKFELNRKWHQEKEHRLNNEHFLYKKKKSKRQTDTKYINDF